MKENSDCFDLSKSKELLKNISIRSKSTIKESHIDTKMYNNIDREINNTLEAFNTERTKQINALGHMKQQLKRLIRKPEKIYFNENMNGNKENNIEKYIKYIKAQENQLIKVEKELVITKQELREKEEKIKKLTIENNKLRNMIDSYKTEIKQKVSGILHGRSRDVYIELKQNSNENPDFDDLLEGIHNMLNYLITERENMEMKYAKLFDLHNKQIQINSQKNVLVIDNESNRYFIYI